MSAAKEIRISADNTGLHQVLYKFDSSQPGWYPKPFEKTSIHSWNRVFTHDDPSQGYPVTVNESPCYERGHRQHWKYKVTYAGKYINIY